MTHEEIKDCIELAQLHKSNLSEDALALEGMSSANNRHLLNLLCEGKKYLEIGTHKGSTLIAATENNGATGLAYDDYRRFGNHADFVNGLIDKFGVDAKLVVDDGMNHKGREKYDVIFYDGDHAYESCKNAIIHFKKYLKKDGIIIIDDYMYEPTMKAVNDTDCSYLIKLEANSRNKKPVVWDHNGWFNGLAILQF